MHFKMFETEDMIPRAAPKPSSQPSDAVGILQPLVPEVSILFGQHEPTGVKTSSSEAVKSQPTYAAWKKQILPRVSYPPPIVEATDAEYMRGTGVTGTDYVSIRPNVYPLRPNTAPVVSASAQATYNNGLLQHQHQRRSLDNAVTNAYTTPPLTLGERGYAHAATNGGYYAPQCRSLDHVASLSPRCQPSMRSTGSDVLTICAGTQTDSVTPPSAQDINSCTALRQVASKQDIAELHAVIQAMREEQLRLSQMCEALLTQHQQLGATTRVVLKDSATQCESNATHADRATPFYQYPLPECNTAGQGDGTSASSGAMRIGANFRFRPFQSPRASPQAQSTGYRPNTPVTQSPQHTPAPLAKSKNENTLVMNELALKYLPNEKLNELMHELNIEERASPETPLQPLRAIENVDRRPSDISNASYRYLKKYRLLPDEPNGYAYEQHQQEEEDELKTPENCRHPPNASPVAGATPTSAQHPKMVDLDGLRNKPKFL